MLRDAFIDFSDHCAVLPAAGQRQGLPVRYRAGLTLLLEQQKQLPLPIQLLTGSPSVADDGARR
jgi:hypothetical protein